MQSTIVQYTFKPIAPAWSDLESKCWYDAGKQQWSQVYDAEADVCG